MCDTGPVSDAALRLAHVSPSKSRGFPNGIATGMLFGLASSGTVSVGCDTAASRGAIVGVAGRSCFGLSNSPSGTTASRVLCVGTSGCAPMSDAFVAANSVVSIGRAPVSFAAPGDITRSVGQASFRRVGGKGKCSRG